MTMFMNFLSVISEIMKEAGVYSTNRVIPIWLIIIHTFIYVAVTIFLAGLMLYIGDITAVWPYWGEFTTVYLGVVGICGTWLSGNKLINSAHNTEKGKPGKPGVNL